MLWPNCLLTVVSCTPDLAVDTRGGRELGCDVILTSARGLRDLFFSKELDVPCKPALYDNVFK